LQKELVGLLDFYLIPDFLVFDGGEPLFPSGLWRWKRIFPVNVGLYLVLFPFLSAFFCLTGR
jgi:hypothetical protein